MPYIIHRSRWRAPPPPGHRVQLNHPLAHRLWSAGYYSNHYAHDAFRDQAPLALNTGSSDYKSRVYKGGRYRTIYKVTGGTPYWYNRGRVGLSASSSITLMALMGGDGRSSFRSLRCQLSTGVAGNPYPGLYEGDGTNNVWSAGFLGAGSVTVSAHGTSPAGQFDSGRVVTAVYRNGTGLELWVDGVQEAFTSSALNLNGAPAFWQATGAATILEFPAIMLAWDRPLTGGEIGALSENPFQVLKPAQTPVFYSLGAGAISLVGAVAQSSTAASTSAVVQTHALVAASATSATAASTGAVSSSGTLAGESAVSGTAASGGAVSQVHTVAGAGAQSATQVSGAAVSQSSVLAGSASTSATALSTGSVAQTHALAAASSASATATSAGAVAQTQVLAGEGAQSATQASAGTVTSAGTWTGAPAVSETVASPGAVTQDHLLTAADAVSAGLLTAAQVTQVHVLTAGGAVSSTQASGGAVDAPAPGALVGSPAASSTGASAGSVTQTHLLAGAAASSATALASGAVSDGTQADVGTYEPVWFRARTVAPVRFLQ